MAPPNFSNLAAKTHEIVQCNNSPKEISSPTTFYGAYIDNSENSEVVWVSLLDDSSSPTVGTDEPDDCIPVRAGAKLPFVVNGGVGRTIANNLYVWCTKTAGVAGTTSPANAVKVTVYAAA